MATKRVKGSRQTEKKCLVVIKNCQQTMHEKCKQRLSSVLPLLWLPGRSAWSIPFSKICLHAWRKRNYLKKWKSFNVQCSELQKNIILTKDHWLLVEAQSFSFLSSELCPTYVLYTGVFFPQHLLNEFARPKNVEATFLLFEIAWQVNTKSETLSSHMLYLRQPLPIHFSC